jgi:hypothetical protein
MTNNKQRLTPLPPLYQKAWFWFVPPVARCKLART